MPDLDTPDYQVADIVGFEGSWGSGMATLVLKDMGGNLIEIPCDNGPTVRALASMFEDVITPGHCVNQSAIRGKRILYHLDDIMGMLDWMNLPDGEEVDS
jgi:hypothetical protein